ncbi:hypothetical protein JZ751_027331, partial [Albula glossodonta]
MYEHLPTSQIADSRLRERRAGLWHRELGLSRMENFTVPGYGSSTHVEVRASSTLQHSTERVDGELRSGQAHNHCTAGAVVMFPTQGPLMSPSLLCSRDHAAPGCNSPFQPDSAFKDPRIWALSRLFSCLKGYDKLSYTTEQNTRWESRRLLYDPDNNTTKNCTQPGVWFYSSPQ